MLPDPTAGGASGRDRRIKRARGDRDPGGQLSIRGRAVRAGRATRRARTVQTYLGALLGLIAAGGWAWWAAARHQRREAPEGPAAVLRTRLLGETPEFRAEPLGAGELKSATAMPGAVRGAYHFVLASLEHALSTRGGSSVVVVSAGRRLDVDRAHPRVATLHAVAGWCWSTPTSDRNVSGRTGWHHKRGVFNPDGDSVVLQ
jgi:hypothetical protein